MMIVTMLCKARFSFYYGDNSMIAMAITIMMTMVRIAVTMAMAMLNLLARATPSSLLFPSFVGAVLAASPEYHHDDYHDDEDTSENYNKENEEDDDDKFSPYIRAASLSLPAWDFFKIRFL